MSPILMHSKNIFLVVMLVLFTQLTNAQPKPLSDSTKVSIITCGSGEQLHALFGHTAIRVNDPAQGLDVVFNYGTFDFDTPFFYLKFVRGNLDYFLSATDFQTFMQAYTFEQRDVFEQPLIATTRKKQKLFDALYNQLNSESKFYRYKFIEQNCTTMVKDQLIDLWSADLLAIQKINIDELSYRATVNRFLEEKYFQRLGINLLFGSNTDQMANEIFLPEELMASLTISKVAEGNIAEGSSILYKAPTKETSSSFLNSLFTVIIILAALFIIKKKNIDLLVLKIFGVLGVLLLVVMLLTEHNEVWWNYHVLLFNPILFVIAYAALKQKSTLFIYGRYALALSIILYLYLIFRTDVLKLVFPFIIYMIIICFRLDKYNVTTS